MGLAALTRTLMIGRVSDKMKHVYKVVLEAQLAAISTQLDDVATQVAAVRV